MKISFRASFAGPTEKLNPSGWKIPKPDAQTIEVYRRGKFWYARFTEQRALPEITQLGREITYIAMQANVQESFEVQRSDWKMWNEQGVPVDPDTVEEQPDGKFIKRVITHSAHLDQNGMPGNYFRTVCGLKVFAHEVRSKRSQHPPDCKVCREEWAKMPKEQRLP